VIDPTIHNICDYWFQKDQNRLRDMRVDTLSQMLMLGNVRPGGRYLVVDQASGILISAILDRLDGGYPSIIGNLASRMTARFGESNCDLRCRISTRVSFHAVSKLSSLHY